MNISKRRILMNSFFNSQLKCYPLVWMFHSSLINNKINRLHERVMRIVYSDFKSSFKNLLKKDETVSMRVKNLQKLETEIFKISKNFSVLNYSIRKLIITFCEIHMSFLFQMLIVFSMDKGVYRTSFHSYSS